MKVEIPIYADVKLDELDYDGDIKKIKNELKDEISSKISKFAGSKLGSTLYHENGMYNYLKDVDHEVAFDDEGEYAYIPENHKTCEDQQCPRFGKPLINGECKDV